MAVLSLWPSVREQRSGLQEEDRKDDAEVQTNHITQAGAGQTEKFSSKQISKKLTLNDMVSSMKNVNTWCFEAG